MINSILRFFGLCNHRWNIYHVVNIFRRGDDRPYEFDYHLQCDKCGIVRKKTL